MNKPNSKISHIFYVDDDDADLFFQKLVISEFNPDITVDTFKSPHDALDRLDDILKKKEPLPTFIFTDANMPEMEGWEFIDALDKLFKRYNKTINSPDTSRSILISTGSYVHNPHYDAVKSLIFTFIEKPLTVEAMQQLEDDI